MNHVLIIAAGGALGAAGRHLVGLAAFRLLGTGFPWGTLTVNVLGSLLMGVLIETLALKFSAPAGVRLFLATGILGGFTTFSTFSLDVVILAERGQGALAAAYVMASLALSVGALFAGMWLIRTVAI